MLHATENLSAWWKVWGCSCLGVISGIFTSRGKTQIGEIAEMQQGLQSLTSKHRKYCDSERLPRSSRFLLQPGRISQIFRHPNRALVINKILLLLWLQTHDWTVQLQTLPETLSPYARPTPIGLNPRWLNPPSDPHHPTMPHKQPQLLTLSPSHVYLSRNIPGISTSLIIFFTSRPPTIEKREMWRVIEKRKMWRARPRHIWVPKCNYCYCNEWTINLPADWTLSQRVG